MNQGFQSVLLNYLESRTEDLSAFSQDFFSDVQDKAPRFLKRCGKKQRFQRIPKKTRQNNQLVRLAFATN